jgi:hypothetical protein
MVSNRVENLHFEVKCCCAKLKLFLTFGSVLLVAKKFWELDQHLVFHIISFIVGGWNSNF